MVWRLYPYTNFHELNLNWLTSEIKRLSTEWIEYNNNWADWRDDTDKKLEELKKYVDDYFSNLDITTEITNIFNELVDSGFFDELVNRALLTRTKINTRMVASFFNAYTNGKPSAPNGACYIGNNKMVQYLSTSSNSVGLLQVFDMDSWQKVSETYIELKHGNSLTYDPENKKLYAVALYNNNDTSILLNEVFIVNCDDYLNMYVEDTISLPMPQGSTGVYSLSYDPISKTFAGTIKASPTGSIVAGQTDRLVIYNQELTEIVREVMLEGSLLISNQGIQAYYDNRAYINYCDYNYFNIGVYDTNDGKCVNMIDLPMYIDNYRFIGEPEAFIYNWDSFKWYCSSAYTGSGVSGHIGLTIFEMGIYNNIPDVKLRAQSFNLYNTRRLGITVKNGEDGVSNSPYTMYSLMDAINLCVNNNLQGRITIEENHKDIGSVDIIGYNGDIYGKSANHAKFTGAVRIFNSRIRITFSDFTGSFTEDSRTCSIFVTSSYLSMEGCTFNPQLLTYDTWLTYRNNNGNSTFIRCIVLSQTQPTDATFTQSAFIPYT